MSVGICMTMSISYRILNFLNASSQCVNRLQIRLRDVGIHPNGNAVPVLLPLMGLRGRPQGNLQVGSYYGIVSYNEGVCGEMRTDQQGMIGDVNPALRPI